MSAQRQLCKGISAANASQDATQDADQFRSYIICVTYHWLGRVPQQQQLGRCQSWCLGQQGKPVQFELLHRCCTGLHKQNTAVRFALKCDDTQSPVVELTVGPARQAGRYKSASSTCAGACCRLRWTRAAQLCSQKGKLQTRHLTCLKAEARQSQRAPCHICAC